MKARSTSLGFSKCLLNEIIFMVLPTLWPQIIEFGGIQLVLDNLCTNCWQIFEYHTYTVWSASSEVRMTYFLLEWWLFFLPANPLARGNRKYPYSRSSIYSSVKLLFSLVELFSLWEQDLRYLQLVQWAQFPMWVTGSDGKWATLACIPWSPDPHTP